MTDHPPHDSDQTAGRLSELLHEATPEPPASIDLAVLAGRIQGGRSRRRWLTPLTAVTAAAAVVTVVAAAAGIARMTGDDAKPTPVAGSPTTTDTPLIATASKGPGGPQFTWARQAVARWEARTAGDEFVPLGSTTDWGFQQVSTAPTRQLTALASRKISSGIALPDQAPAAGTITWADGQARPATVLSAKAAFDQLLAGGTRCAHCPDTVSSGQKLTVSAVAADTIRVPTTRGDATVPAWRFSFAGTALQALQAAVQARVVPPLSPGFGTDDLVPAAAADLAADGRTLTAHFLGPAAGAQVVCGADYTGYAVESRRAVGLVIIQHRNPSRVPCPSADGRYGIGSPRTVTIHLSTPLEDRAVLETRRGTPIPVTRH